VLPVKAFLDGVKGAGSDVSEDNAEGSESEKQDFFIKPPGG
jgi:hypothetical protein